MNKHGSIKENRNLENTSYSVDFMEAWRKMKSKRQPTALTLLLLITAILLFSGCENGANADKVIIDQEQMAAEFAAVNTAITRFNELKRGTIISVYTGTFMPGSKVTMDEMSFERTNNGIKYSIIETYVEGDSFVVEETAEDGVLPDFAYIYYPNEQLQVESILDTAEKMTVWKMQGFQLILTINLAFIVSQIASLVTRMH